RIGIFAVLLGLIASTRAATVRTLDGKVYQGEISFEPPNQIIVIPPSGTPTRIAFPDLLQASFRSRAPGQLPMPWQGDDIGDVTRGATATFAGGIFTLRAASLPEASHFVHRGVLGDGEISAHLLDFPSARAGSR